MIGSMQDQMHFCEGAWVAFFEKDQGEDFK